VALWGAEMLVLVRLLRGGGPELYLRAHGHDVLGNVLLGDDARITKPLFERRNAVLEQHLLVLRVVVLGVLRDVPEFSGDADALSHLAAFDGRELLDLVL